MLNILKIGLNNIHRLHLRFLLFSVILFLSISITGCTLFPNPSDLIISPTSQDPVLHIIQSFLSENSVLIIPDNRMNTTPYLLYDIDQNGKDEVMFVIQYLQSSANQNKLEVCIIKDFHEEWKLVWKVDNYAMGMDFVDLIDLTDNGIPEIVLGWNSGTSLQKGLDLYQIIDIVSFTTSRDFSTEYTMIEKPNLVSTLERKYLFDKKEIVIWKKEKEDAFSVDIFQFNDPKTILQSSLEPVPMNKQYPDYFKKVVTYYQSVIDNHQNESIYWYYYAQALLYASSPEESLNACSEGLVVSKVSNVFPSQSDFNYIKGLSLFQLNKVKAAQDIFSQEIDYLQKKKLKSREEETLLCQLQLALAKIFIQENELSEAYRLTLHPIDYIETSFRSKTQTKTVSKIPLDIIVTKKDLEETLYLLQSTQSFLAIQNATFSTDNPLKQIALSSDFYPDQECQLHFYTNSIHCSEFQTISVIDFSDIQPTFYFDNGIDNGFPYHAIAWNDGSETHYQMIFNSPLLHWPLSKTSIIDCTSYVANRQSIVLYFKNSPMVCFLEFTPGVDQWRYTWYPRQDKWRANNGSLEMDQEDSILTTYGYSTTNYDYANKIFKESMNSFYREFIDTWILEEDQTRYKLLNSSVVENPYSILVDYIYLLSTDQKSIGDKYLRNRNAIPETMVKKLVQNPLRQEWEIIDPHHIEELTNYIVFRSNQNQTFKVLFSTDNNTVKIQSILTVD